MYVFPCVFRRPAVCLGTSSTRWADDCYWVWKHTMQNRIKSESLILKKIFVLGLLFQILYFELVLMVMFISFSEEKNKSKNPQSWSVSVKAEIGLHPWFWGIQAYSPVVQFKWQRMSRLNCRPERMPTRNNIHDFGYFVLNKSVLQWNFRVWGKCSQCHSRSEKVPYTSLNVRSRQDLVLRSRENEAVFQQKGMPSGDCLMCKGDGW